MKNLKLKNHCLSGFVVVFFLLIAFGSEDDKSNENKSSNNTNETTIEKPVEPIKNDTQTNKPAITQSESKYLINDGYYDGSEICSCCGENANKPIECHNMQIKNISETKISFYYLEFQKREIIGNVENGKIIIDERNLGLESLVFWGTVEVIDKNTIKIDIAWEDATEPKGERAGNHCIETFHLID